MHDWCTLYDTEIPDILETSAETELKDKFSFPFSASDFETMNTKGLQEVHRCLLRQHYAWLSTTFDTNKFV